jgi:hypothetical protein
LKNAKILKRWPLTMLVIILQELVVYNSLDFESFIDFNEYFGTIIYKKNEKKNIDKYIFTMLL